MMRMVIVDTGPVVSFLNKHDTFHAWTVEQWGRIKPPLLTCEAVVSEVCFLLRNFHWGQRAVLELLKRNILEVPFRLMDEREVVAALLDKYADLPVSLADACLIRMAEIYPKSRILTLDRYFTVYRKRKKQAIPLLSPFF